MCRGGGMSADSGCWVSEGGGSGDRDNGSMIGCDGSRDCRCRHSSFRGGDRGGGIEFGRILIGYLNASVSVCDDIWGDVGGETGGGEGRGCGGNGDWDTGGSGGGDISD
ncbi:hypothetical protein L195_g013740 [Trifolium pratense]|uniref:Uncharacterized protein n=1 Tax=Trifolium pratense TaxID=57577 RepID=A0A2K3PP02_TRIPR|nr:hypothetical protein L195_g013740 [Trifolium pratense]